MVHILTFYSFLTDSLHASYKYDRTHRQSAGLADVYHHLCLHMTSRAHKTWKQSLVDVEDLLKDAAWLEKIKKEVRSCLHV